MMKNNSIGHWLSKKPSSR
uniref:Uncharacterized protein n=1 Tax=Anguilla anguilla TaxID=7936 RepID=A0A0E9P839_ANGAN